MARRVDPLAWQSPIATKEGRPTPIFIRQWQNLLALVGDIATTLTAAVTAQDSANSAQTAADAAQIAADAAQADVDALTASEAVVDLTIEALGSLEDDERVAFIRFRRGYTLASNFGDAVGRGDPAATGSSVFTFKKNGVTFGTATFAAAGVAPTFATTGDGSPADGDYWEVFAPATADATLEDVTFSIPLTKV